MMQPIPTGAVRMAEYFYGGDAAGLRLVVYAYKRRYFLRDATGRFPRSGHTGAREPHPCEGTRDMDIAYESLGLYYEYPMPHTGWDGEDEVKEKTHA